MPANTEYSYIRRWGKLIGAATEYIDHRVSQARNEGAPTNAVYRNLDGQWLTTDDVLLPETRAALGLGPLRLKAIDVEQLMHQLRMAIAADGPMAYLYGLDTIEPRPEDAGLRLTFSTGYAADVRLRGQ